jgi:hypothetical protein
MIKEADISVPYTYFAKLEREKEGFAPHIPIYHGTDTSIYYPIQEEEKRIFYVGVTRARDALFLTGIYNPKAIEKESRLCWLIDALDIKQTKDGKFSFSSSGRGAAGALHGQWYRRAGRKCLP